MSGIGHVTSKCHTNSMTHVNPYLDFYLPFAACHKYPIHTHEENFAQHRFYWLTAYTQVPKEVAVHWQLKNLTKNEVIANGEGIPFHKVVISEKNAIGDLIRFHCWRSDAQKFTADLYLHCETEWHDQMPEDCYP